MRHGIRKEIDWAYLGAVMANESDVEQSVFIASFLKECRTWGTHHQVERQLCDVRNKLTPEDREALAMLSHNPHDQP